MKTRDNINYLKKLSPARVWNGMQVVLSYYLSRMTGKARLWGMPLSVAIEPTTACNLGCPECPSGLKQFTRATGNLKLDLFEKFIDQIAKRCSYITFYFQGEPYINPQFLEMVKMGSRKGMYTATSTNAHFITPDVAKRTVESGLDRLIISIDGTTQEVYEQYRKQGSLEKVIAGTKNMIAAKQELGSSTPHLIFQFLVVKPNEHQIEEVHELAKELGVDEVKLKTAQVYDYENGNPLIPENQKYSRYARKSDGTYRVKNALDNHCWRMWSSCVVTWDGNVVPCCFDKDAMYQLGNVSSSSFRNVWTGAAYRGFRQQLLKGRSEIEICKNCSEGTKVWA